MNRNRTYWEDLVLHLDRLSDWPGDPNLADEAAAVAVEELDMAPATARLNAARAIADLESREML